MTKIHHLLNHHVDKIRNTWYFKQGMIENILKPVLAWLLPSLITQHSINLQVSNCRDWSVHAALPSDTFLRESLPLAPFYERVPEGSAGGRAFTRHITYHNTIFNKLASFRLPKMSYATVLFLHKLAQLHPSSPISPKITNTMEISSRVRRDVANIRSSGARNY